MHNAARASLAIAALKPREAPCSRKPPSGGRTLRRQHFSGGLEHRDLPQLLQREARGPAEKAQVLLKVVRCYDSSDATAGMRVVGGAVRTLGLWHW